MSENNMIDKKRIEQEAENFFAWPTDDRNYVTRTSMLIFANTIAEMVRKESEAVIASLRAPTCKNSLTVAPAPQCACLGSQLGPNYCEVHAA